jgi:hypothetical protein
LRRCAGLGVETKTAEEAFQARWDIWWESAGRRDVMGLLDPTGLPDRPVLNGPYWSEAEGIGDSARYGGADAEDLGEMLAGFAEDIDGAEPDRERDGTAAQVIARYFHEHAPTREG